jgi:hypothetical protein
MSRRALAICVAVAAVLTVGGIALSRRDPPQIPIAQPTSTGPGPRSADAFLGDRYAYQVGHCGLRHVVDFDKSYWDVDERTLTQDDDQRFGINSDEGTITLVSTDVAVYRSSRGGEATLRRHDGPKSFFLCA